MHGVHVAPVQFRAARLLPLGLIAQLVERCIRIAEARGPTPLKSTYGLWYSGITRDSGSRNPGSIPGSPTKKCLDFRAFFANMVKLPKSKNNYIMAEVGHLK